MRSAASPAFRRLCLGLALLTATWSLPGVVLADAYPLQAVKTIADTLKPNVLIVLETAESMQGLAGENIARYNEVGADCEDGNRYCRLVGQDGRWNFSGMGAYGMGVAGAACTNTGTYTDVGVTSTTTSTSYDTTTPTSVNTFVSLNATATGTGTGSGSHAVTGTGTRTATGTNSAALPSSVKTVTATGTATTTVTGTWTSNYTSTATASQTFTGVTGTVAVSVTTTSTSAAAVTFSNTVSATRTATLNATVTTTGNATVTGTGNGTASATQTVTASGSATGSVTVKNTLTLTGTDTATGTVTGTITATMTTGETATGTGSGTGSAQVTQTQTVTAQVGTTAGAAVTGTGTGTATVTANGMTGTATATGTGTGSMTATQSKTQTATGSASTLVGTGTANNTAYQTTTPSGTGTVTATYSGSGSGTSVWTYWGTVSNLVNANGTLTATSITSNVGVGAPLTASSTGTVVSTNTAIGTVTVTRTALVTNAQVHNNLTGTATFTTTVSSGATRNATFTASFIETNTNSVLFTSTWSGTTTATGTYPATTATTTATTTQTVTLTSTYQKTGTACATLTGTMTITVNGNVPGSATVTATALATGTVSQTATAAVTATSGITATSTVTGTMSGGITGSATMTGTIGGTGTKTYNTTTTTTTSTHVTQSGTSTATYVTTQTRTGCGIVGDQDLNRCDSPPATPTSSGSCDQAGTTSCSLPSMCTAFKGDFCHQISPNDGSHRPHNESCISTPGTPWGSCKHGVVTNNTSCTSYTDSACNTALAGDYCIEGQPAQMCSDSALWCANTALDCPGSSESCVPATSRLMTVKRALRRAITDNADKVSFGLMTTYQAKGIDGTDTDATTAIYPYVKLTSCPTTANVTETKLLTRGELEKAGCFSLASGPTTPCTLDYGGNGALNSDSSLNRIYYDKATVAGGDSRWIIPRGDGSGKFDHLNVSWSACASNALLPACVFAQGTAIYEGSYYSFSYKQGTPVANGNTAGEGSMAHPVYFSKYMGKFYTDGSNCYNAIDAQRSDIINDGVFARPAYSLVPPATTPYVVSGTGTNTKVVVDTTKEASLSVPWSGAVQNSTCGSKTGALYTPAAVPFMTDTTFGGQALSRAQKALMYAGRLDKASFGGVTATGTMSPIACALDNDQAADQFHSAAGYITQAKINDTAANNAKPACWPNNIILVVDGHADGPGDSGGAIDCASDGCAHGDVDGYANCNCAAITKAYHLAHDQGIQTHVVVNAPANWSETTRYRYTYAFLVNLAKAGSFGFVGAPAFGTSEEELYKGLSDKIAAGAYAFPFTTTVPVAGATTQDPVTQVLTMSSKLFDTSVDYPSWKGNIRAFDTGSGGANLAWDAVGVAYGSTPHPASWKNRRVFFAPKSAAFPVTPIQVAIDSSSGAINNKSDLFAAGLGASADEAEHIMQWLLGKPELGNPAPLMGAISGSTPIAVAQATSNGLSGSLDFSKNTWKRPQLVYVGGDDGMLHAFFGQSQKLNGTDYLGGEEAFAFIPNDMLPTITKLYAQGGQNLAVDKAQHVFGLSSSPKVKDICIGSGCESSTGTDWHTVLMMTEGPGGNKPFALDITNVVSESDGLDVSKLRLLWSAATLGDVRWDQSLGETTALPGFYFGGYVSGAADNRVIFASGYPTVSRSKAGYARQGLLLVNADAASGTIIETKDVGNLPSSTCTQNRAVRSDVAVARNYSAAETSQSLTGAYVTDTWGNAYQYVPNASNAWSRLYTLGCGQPLHFAPAIAQLDRTPQADNSSKHFIYLVQVTNSSSDPDTQPYSSDFPGSQIVVTKLDGNVTPPAIVPSYNTANSNGQIVLATDASTPSSRICLQTFDTEKNSLNPFAGTAKGAGQTCSDAGGTELPATARPVGTPTIVLRSDGLGFQAITSWYDATVMSNDCSSGKQFNYGTSYLTVHEFGADGTWYQIAGVSLTNTVLTGVTFVGTGLFVDGIMGSNDNAPQGVSIGEAFASMQQVFNNSGLERYARTSWSERLQ